MILLNLTDKFLTVSFQNVYERIGFLLNSTAFVLDVVATVPAKISVSFAIKAEIIHFLEKIIIIITIKKARTSYYKFPFLDLVLHSI